MFLVSLLNGQLLRDCLPLLASLVVACALVSDVFKAVASKKLTTILSVSRHLQAYDPSAGEVSWTDSRESDRLVFGLSCVERRSSLGLLPTPPTIWYLSAGIGAQKPCSLTMAGTIVRYGPNRISVNSVDGLKAIYGSKANTRKSTVYSVFSHFFDRPSTETTIDVREHLRKRRALSKALSDKSLKALEGALWRNVKKLCRQLASGSGDSTAEAKILDGWSPPRDMAVIGNCMTFDIMGDFCFGRSFQMMEVADNRYLMDVISDGAQGLNIVGLHGGLPDLL